MSGELWVTCWLVEGSLRSRAYTHLHSCPLPQCPQEAKPTCPRRKSPSLPAWWSSRSVWTSPLPSGPHWGCPATSPLTPNHIQPIPSLLRWFHIVPESVLQFQVCLLRDSWDSAKSSPEHLQADVSLDGLIFTARQEDLPPPKDNPPGVGHEQQQP